MNSLLSKVVVGLVSVSLLVSSYFCLAGDALGVISKQQLLDDYHEFSQNYKSYVASEREEQAVSSLPSDISIKVYFATWCHDSEREVPRLLSLFNKQQTKIELIALDFEKSDPLGQAKTAGIKYTPTIVVYQQGEEIGRIIESPKQSLGEDIQAML